MRYSSRKWRESPSKPRTDPVLLGSVLCNESVRVRAYSYRPRRMARERADLSLDPVRYVDVESVR
jgi:hypothetical protein